MSDITQIKRSLASQAEQVCAHLLPEGRREKDEWVYDPGTGKVKVSLRGAKAGIWSWFGGDDEGGDLIDLWRWRKGLSVVQALDEARDYLGIEKPEFIGGNRRSFKRPEKPNARALRESRARDYLIVERNIPEESLKAYKISESRDGETIIFPFLVGGELYLAKARKAGDGEKPVPTASGCEPVLMGWHLVTDDDRDIVLVEGEIDAPSLHAYGVGMPVLSLPFGGGKGRKQAQWIENDFERLQQFDRIFIASDNDKEGDLAAEEIASRLGRHRCLRVTLPRKDANACLVDGIPREEILECIKGASALDPTGLKSVLEYRDDVVELFYPKGGHVGYTLPFSKIGDRFLCRPGEMTIWSGATASGKSQTLGECCCHWVASGSVVVMASLEMAPRQNLRRLTRQAGGVEQPTEAFIDRILHWFDGENDGGGRLLIYDKVGKMSLDEVLDVFTYARCKYGADQFIVDSLMRLGLETDDYNGQEKVVYSLTNWTIENDVHMHMVAHNRKADGGAYQGIEGIKGAMEVGANAFNQIEIIRNRDVEAVVDKHERGETLTEKELPLLDMPGVILAVNKQRNGDWSGKVGLWFERSSYQYHSQKPSPTSLHRYVSMVSQEEIGDEEFD